MALQAVSVVQPAWVQEVLNSYTTDSQAQQLLQRLAITSPDTQGYSLDKGIIWYQAKYGLGAIQLSRQNSSLPVIPVPLGVTQALLRLTTGSRNILPGKG